ncbi:E3 ubiquitin-protein ligase ATL6 [Lolium perenne]|uniref:E3 ubiquitin-protein ligase ATL6 n=1 Tax=Lolium perenne TaxID=4522 RepID=UPI0021EA9E32|nr:E3 ubiquitin-protein ligase ATL6-like [Lolium perenne]
MEPSRCGNGRLLLFILVVLAAGDLASAQSNPPPPGFGAYATNFSPSMAIVIVVLIAAFFFLGFFSVYIRHCYGEQLGYSAARLPIGTGTAARSRRQRGLDPAVLETFPTMAYADVKEHKAIKGALECAVCLSEFDDDETLRLLPKCSHVFHPDCIDTWLASHVTCPVCRANLVPEDPNAPSTGDDVPAELSDPSVSQLQEVPPPASPTAAAPAVVIDVDETEDERIIREETDELTRIGSLKRALRSKSSRAPARFARSYSTGHSLVARAGTGTGAGAERFTLRLPENVLREAVAAGKLRRTKSLIAFTSGRQGSTRRALRIGAGEGSSRGGRSVRLGQSGRWPSFLTRTLSAAWGSRSTRRVAESDGSSKGGKPAGAGGKSVDCNDQACALGHHV